MYVDQKGSDAIPAIKRTAGSAPEVNLRNQVHVNNEACKRVMSLALKPTTSERDQHGYLWPKKANVLQNFKKKKFLRCIYNLSIL